jgi:hypothetical protein
LLVTDRFLVIFFQPLASCIGISRITARAPVAGGDQFWPPQNSARRTFFDRSILHRLDDITTTRAHTAISIAQAVTLLFRLSRAVLTFCSAQLPAVNFSFPNPKLFCQMLQTWQPLATRHHPGMCGPEYERSAQIVIAEDMSKDVSVWRRILYAHLLSRSCAPARQTLTTIHLNYSGAPPLEAQFFDV